MVYQWIISHYGWGILPAWHLLQPEKHDQMPALCKGTLVAVRKGHGWKEVAVVSMLPGQVLTPKSTKIEGYTLFWTKDTWSTNDLQWNSCNMLQLTCQPFSISRPQCPKCNCKTHKKLEVKIGSTWLFSPITPIRFPWSVTLIESLNTSKNIDNNDIIWQNDPMFEIQPLSDGFIPSNPIPVLRILNLQRLIGWTYLGQGEPGDFSALIATTEDPGNLNLPEQARHPGHSWNGHIWGKNSVTQ